MLKNKVVIIVGGCGLIGRKFVESVLDNKGTAIIADIDKNKGRTLSEELSKKDNFGKVDFFELDINSKDSISNLINSVSTKYNQIDAFVNASLPKSKLPGGLFEEITYEKFTEEVSLHLGGYFLIAQQAAEYFNKQGFGNLINISSIQGVAAPKFDTYEGVLMKGKQMTSSVQYTCIKTAIIALTQYMAKYFKNSGIRFNCISPGGILDNQPQKFLEKYKKYCSSKGMLDPEDLTGALIFLLSDASKYINGQNIVVDDGWSL